MTKEPHIFTPAHDGARFDDRAAYERHLAREKAASQMLAALKSIRWKSMDIDNMEFTCAITYSQMDAIRDAIAAAEAAGIRVQS